VKVLVVTDDRLGPVMAGSALRAWELARVLATAGHETRVVGAEGSTKPTGEGPELAKRARWRWADAVLIPAWNLTPRLLLSRRLLIIDGATPLPAELSAMKPTPEVRRRRRTAAARIPVAAARADAVLVAGEAQNAWWREHLDARRRLPPLLEVPFGIPEPPAPERDEIEGVPPTWAVVLWWGGVWPWLDLETLLEARARLGEAPISVVVPTAGRPGGHPSSLTAAELQAMVGRHGLRSPQVVALRRWVPYHERHRILHRTSLIAVFHRSGREADLSFRTRALDGVWCSVPLLLSEGGEVARLTRKHGWGGVVAPADPQAAAAAMEILLGEREQLRCRQNLVEARSSWLWSTVAAPLVDALPELPQVPRRWSASAIGEAAARYLGVRRPD